MEKEPFNSMIIPNAMRMMLEKQGYPLSESQWCLIVGYLASIQSQIDDFGLRMVIQSLERPDDHK